MRYPKLVLASFTIASTVTACVATDTAHDPLSGADHHDGSGTGTGTGSGSCGGSGACAALDADLTITVAGSGVFVGASPGCVDLSGNFTATIDASAHASDCAGDAWTITAAGAAAIHTAGGCTCDDIAARACALASASVHAEIAADAASCGWFCDGHGGDTCAAACDHPGNVIVADASLDVSAFAGVDLGAIDAAALADLGLHLDFDHVEDGAGHTVTL